MNLVKIILDGGAMMWPLLALSIASLAIIYERYMAFRAANVDAATLRNEVFGLLQKNELDKAMQLCANTPGPTSAILLVGLRRYRKLQDMQIAHTDMEDKITRAMEDFAPHVIEVLEGRLGMLAMIGTTAPLLGMTGTVTGMIASFNSIVTAGQMDPTMVAGGISEALITTATGLLIAVPAVIAYHVYTRRVERFTLEIEEAASKLVEFVTTGSE